MRERRGVFFLPAWRRGGKCGAEVRVSYKISYRDSPRRLKNGRTVRRLVKYAPLSRGRPGK